MMLTLSWLCLCAVVECEQLDAVGSELRCGAVECPDRQTLLEKPLDASGPKTPNNHVSASQTMIEEGMKTIPDDPAQQAMFSAMLMPLHQTPTDPMAIAVRTL